MRGATSPMFPLRLTLKVCWRTGSTFEHVCSLESTSFAEVKVSAVRFFKQNDLHFDQRRSSVHYKLISIASKRRVDEEKTLKDAQVRDGDEYLLVKKTTQHDKTFVHCSIDVAMVDYRTEDLPAALHLFHRESFPLACSEFYIDLHRILFNLVDISLKLLSCHPDAEHLHRQAGACEYLLRDEVQQGFDSTSSIFEAILENAAIQKTLNHPKTFFILRKLVDHPTSIIDYLDDPHIGKMLIEISRIYHVETEDLYPARTMTESSSSTDFDDDSE